VEGTSPHGDAGCNRPLSHGRATPPAPADPGNAADRQPSYPDDPLSGPHSRVPGRALALVPAGTGSRALAARSGPGRVSP
jgi:hypothetical protein